MTNHHTDKPAHWVHGSSHVAETLRTTKGDNAWMRDKAAQAGMCAHGYLLRCIVGHILWSWKVQQSIPRSACPTRRSEVLDLLLDTWVL